MRPLLPLALLALALPGTPLAGAHADDAVNHFTVLVDDLAPGATREVHATFEEGPLREGWVMIVVGGIVGTPARLDLELSLHNETVKRWEWQSGNGAINLQSFALPATSEDYVFHLRNPNADTVRFFFYFDQSCNCLAKPLPFPGSYAIFNFDFLAGETAWFSFEKPANLTLEYSVATRKGAGGTWPGDFDVVKRYPEDALPNGTLRFDVPKDRTYYIMVQSAGGEGMIEPRLRISHEAAKPTPPAPLLLVLAAAAVLALTLPRRRA